MLIRTLLAFCLLLNLAYGAETWVRLTVQTQKGSTKVNAYHYTNHWGRREVRLEANTLPRIGKVNPILGYGRDTDDDGTVDTWFMIDSDEGLVRHELPPRSGNVWGHESVQNRLFKRYHSTFKAHFSAAYGAVFGYLLMSISHGWASEREFWRELMDLEEFGMRLERSKKHGELTRAQWNDSVDLLMSGYDDTIKRFQRATGREYWSLAGADVLLWATGGIVVKGLGKVLGVLGRPLANTALVTEGKAVLGRIISKITDRARAQLARFRGLKGAPLNILAANVFKQKFPGHMRALMAKNHFMRKMVPMIARTGIALRKATQEWKYIAFMGSLQMTTEAFAHSSEVMSSNPTQVAKNVLSHPDIMQNVGFMTSDAFLMTAASHGIKPKGIRYATCGFIALSNSTITNVVIKGDRDYTRIALDTGWEAVVGNAQVQIDLAALKHFESQALKAGNPRLKLLGWAVVLVDQAAGFVGYSQATQALERSRQDIQLVPVVAEN